MKQQQQQQGNEQNNEKTPFSLSSSSHIPTPLSLSQQQQQEPIPPPLSLMKRARGDGDDDDDDSSSSNPRFTPPNACRSATTHREEEEEHSGLYQYRMNSVQILQHLSISNGPSHGLQRLCELVPERHQALRRPVAFQMAIRRCVNAAFISM